ncbi:MAG: RNA polymerase sigma factor [Balneolaceae bacterium]|nr:RNA polymerase sigma factor [Balneolaceae bacterium]
MTEAQQGEIFRRWLHQHKGLLFKIICAYAFSETDRDDLFQEISIQLWRSVPNFREESAVSTWVYRVALNTAIKWNRDEQKHQKGRLPFDHTGHLLQKNNQQKDERLDWLYEELGKLDKIDRSLCLLMLDGFSYREMSKILGISESNVGVKIHRIKKHLTEKSEEYDRHEI